MALQLKVSEWEEGDLALVCSFCTTFLYHPGMTLWGILPNTVTEELLFFFFFNFFFSWEVLIPFPQLILHEVIESQKGLGWKRPQRSSCFSPSLPWAGTPCPGPHCSKPPPTWPGTLSGMGHPQLVWTACTSASTPSQGRFSSKYLIWVCPLSVLLYCHSLLFSKVLFQLPCSSFRYWKLL